MTVLVVAVAQTDAGSKCEFTNGTRAWHLASIVVTILSNMALISASAVAWVQRVTLQKKTAKEEDGKHTRKKMKR